MAYGLSNGHVTDDVSDPKMCCEAVQSAILAPAWLLVWLRAMNEASYSSVSYLAQNKHLIIINSYSC